MTHRLRMTALAHLVTRETAQQLRALIAFLKNHAALLHDVLEDTPLTAAELAAEGFPREVLEAVVCLTRVRDEDYAVYIERVCGNRLAAAVKLADLTDLTDNMDLNRLPGLTQRDFQRLERYIRAKRRVEQALEEWDERGDKHG